MNFTVYKSSAGSGKTFTLVKEYLKLALKSENAKEYKSILAITFTNKAAAEMKERVLLALKSFSSKEKLEGTPQFLLLELEKELKLPQHEIRAKAEKVLSSMLHNYSDIGISTIDKFTHRIIRTFAYDLHIKMNFSVETDEKEMLEKAIDMVLGKIGEDLQLTEVLKEFTVSKAEDEKNWSIESDLFNFSKSLLKDEGISHIEKLKEISIEEFNEIKKTLQSTIRDFEKTISTFGKDGLASIASLGIDKASFAGGANGLPKYFEYLSTLKYDKLKPSNTIQKAIADDKWFSAKASVDDKHNIESIKGRLFEIYNKAMQTIDSSINEITLFRSINKNIYSLITLNEIEKAIVQIKNEDNILHISEFNRRIANIVMYESAPFIYERLGEKYKHFLIDEFQDTSVLQCQNLLPLIDNSLANGNFNMLVGDGKQSIYRWRGGDVEQFTALPEMKMSDNSIVQEREKTLKRNYRGEILQHNFRSKMEVVQFNNDFFKSCVKQSDNGLIANVYDKGEQLFNPTNIGGGVSIEFIPKNEENEFTYDELSCFKILETIQQLQEDNFELRDIAIICRINSKANIIANYLIENGIPILSKESLLLSSSATINFILSTLEYIHNRSNNIAKANIIQFICKLKNKEINTSEELMAANIFEFMEKHNIAFNLSRLSSLPIYELCEEIIRNTGLNEKANPYIQFFLDAVYKFSVKNNLGISGFLEWWESKKDTFSVHIPEGMNAVNILTIHKSKGLEFPAVIFAFANWQSMNNDAMWVSVDNNKIPKLKAALIQKNKSFDDTDYAPLLEVEKSKENMDNLNMLYVALTRPKERLYIITDKAAGQKKIAQYYQNYLTEIGEWKEDKTIYRFGLFHKYVQNNTNKSEEPFTLTKFISEPWQDKLKISTEFENIDQNVDTENQKKYGNLLHTALASIKSGEDVAPSLTSMLQKGLISLEEQNKLNTILINLISHKDIQAFFAKELYSKNERDILLPNGETYRPDRVILNEKSAIILDYKTGKANKSYAKQLNKYGTILEQMGYTSVEKYLIYTEEQKLEKIN